MNRHTTWALVQDAYYQVLDNLVFRILVILSMCLALPAFLVAFKENELSILFGWKVIPYSEMGWTGTGSASAFDFKVTLIQAAQSLFVEGFIGNLGILISLAATAFFVPRMLEKGEADTLFSKPVGRFVLLLARYSSGVLFVGVLAFLLVLGIHLGLLLRSGYSDPGFLWGALTLVYVFATIHAFSTMIAVVTRSSVAALLLSILLFWGNGGIQCLWVDKEHLLEVQRIRNQSNEDDAASSKETELDGPVWRSLFAILDAFHLVLPKTNDADVLTKKLRLAVSGDDFVLLDPAGKLAIERNPKDLVRASAETRVDLSTGPATWISHEDGREVARLTVSRRNRVEERKSGSQARAVRTSTGTASNELVKSLEARADVKGKPSRKRSPEQGPARDRVTWTELRNGAEIRRERAFLAIDDWMYEIDLEAGATWLARDEREGMLDDFVQGLKPQRDSAIDLSYGEWYERRFGWTAPLKFNAFFSLGTTIAFALAMLLIARWRIARINF